MFSFFRRAPVEAAPTLVPDTRDAPLEPEEDAPPVFEVRVALKSDVGCVRELNEDSVGLVQPDSPFELAHKGVLLMMCDGMGGHAGGEVASKLAVETISEHYMKSSKPTAFALKEALLAANSAIFEKAKRDSSLKGMGTTGTALVIRGESATCAHVGDSRLYLIRGGGIYQMSEDHSAVMEMVRRGLLAPEEARHHPQKNVVLRAVGTQPQVEVSLWDEPFPLRAGDKWLLCSDGLSDLVEDAELLNAVQGQDLEAAGDTLVALARQRGGHDNISAVIAEIVPIGTSDAIDESANKTDSAMVETREVKIS